MPIDQERDRERVCYRTRQEAEDAIFAYAMAHATLDYHDARSDALIVDKYNAMMEALDSYGKAEREAGAAQAAAVEGAAAAAANAANT